MHAKKTFEDYGEELKFHLLHLLDGSPDCLACAAWRLPILIWTLLGTESSTVGRSVGWENRSSFDLCDLLHLQNDDDYDMRSSSNVRVYKRTHIMYTRLCCSAWCCCSVDDEEGEWIEWVRINLTSNFYRAFRIRIIWKEIKFSFHSTLSGECWRKCDVFMLFWLWLFHLSFGSVRSISSHSPRVSFTRRKKLIVYQIGSRVHHMLQWFTL